MSYGIVDDRLRLYARDLVRIGLSLPKNLEEQKEIAERLSAIGRALQRTERDLAKLRLLKLGLMHDLLTGRVRVPVPETATGATEA